MPLFTVTDLVHKWANRNFTKKELETRCYGANYEADNTEFRRGSRVLAKHYKTFIALKTFDGTGAFGNGINVWHLRSAIPYKNKKTVIISDELLTEEIINNEESFKYWYKDHFININQNLFEDLSILKEFIYNNRVSTTYITDEINFNTGLSDKFYNKHKRILSKIHIKLEAQGRKYQGWGRYNYTTCKPIIIDYTVRQLLKNTNTKYYFTKKEKELYDFKFWHIKYRDIYGFSLKESRKAYYDKERKESLELKGEEIVKRRQEIANQKLEEKQKKDNLKHFKTVDSWLKKEISNISYNYNYYYSKNYQLLRLQEDKEYPYILTSLNVRVTIEEAKRALALFRRYKDVEEPIYLENLQIAGFSVRGVENIEIFVYNNGDPKIENHNCLIVGCHKIPYFEIERFLSDNNLDW